LGLEKLSLEEVMRSCRTLSLSLLLAVVLGLPSCAGRAPPRDTENHIQKAGLVFTRCMQKNRGKPPTSEKELADFLKSQSQSDLEAMGIKDREQALISPRDGQPYAVNPKLDTSMMMGGGSSNKMSSNNPPIAMYERVGVGGKRFVVFLTGGGVTEMADEEFRRVVPHAK
jgi:hypothetical protein